MEEMGKIVEMVGGDWVRKGGEGEGMGMLGIFGNEG